VRKDPITGEGKEGNGHSDFRLNETTFGGGKGRKNEKGLTDIQTEIEEGHMDSLLIGLQLSPSLGRRRKEKERKRGGERGKWQADGIVEAK